MLSSVLIVLEGDYTIALRRAPDLRQACTEARAPPAGIAWWLRCELLAWWAPMNGARRAEIPARAHRRANGIHPHHGVFRRCGEYVDLVAQAPLPSKTLALMWA